MAKWALEKATGEDDALLKALLELMEEKWDRCVLDGCLPVVIFVRLEELSRLQEWAGMPKDVPRGDITFRNTVVVGVRPGEVIQFGPIFMAREEDMPEAAASLTGDPSIYRFAPLGEGSCWLIGKRKGDPKADLVA